MISPPDKAPRSPFAGDLFPRHEYVSSAGQSVDRTLYLLHAGRKGWTQMNGSTSLFESQFLPDDTWIAESIRAQCVSCRALERPEPVLLPNEPWEGDLATDHGSVRLSDGLFRMCRQSMGGSRLVQPRWPAPRWS